MKILKKTYSTLFASMALAVAAVGCSDELDYPHSTVEPGLPATISVAVSLPEMTPITRADMRDENEVNSLWIGVYNTAGERTGFKFVEKGQFGTSKDHTDISVNEEIDAKTGESYIVAVANYEGRKCLDGCSLEDALKGAETYESFKNISARITNDGSVNIDVPINALLMSGHYIEKGEHQDGSFTTPKTVVIPNNKNGVTTLSGSIHLRRLISQVKFEVSYEEANISSFEILSCEVKNVPNQSWLYERADASENVNAGDSQENSFQSSTINNNEIIQNGNTWKFDWWQMENKRTGLESVTDYKHREIEYKNSTDGTNTGKYASLVTENATDLSNNNATLLEMKVRMTMKVDEKGITLGNGKQRVVDAVYTIHLGYCDGNYDAETSSKVRDFNCRRNSKYTYKVNIKNVNDILVEAHKQGENTPGAEGIITDVTDKFVQLDAHYGVYNIYLSEDNLTKGSDGSSAFRYRIYCYDGSETRIEINSEETISSNDPRRKYLDWVEIMPTTAANVLAKYKESGKSIYKLDEFKEAVDNDKITAGYYTIFFNEYVYDNDDWRTYVNKPDRQLWIRVMESQSTDQESTHYEAKYAFSQKSIQTYYGSGNTALGMEHENESYGLNLRNSYNGTSAKNGRYNLYQYTRNKRNATWASFVDFEHYQAVNEINNTTLKQKRDSKLFDNGTQYALPLIQSYTTTSGKTATPDDTYDPDLTSSRNYIEAINACMNRNRDLNGDNVIDNDELRWYVPTTNQYTQIILGTPSLKTPIMDYTKTEKLHENIQINNSAGDWCSQDMNLFLYGSNGVVLWTMEGFSTSNWSDNWEGKNRPQYTMGAAWDVRCVRNLGKNIDLSKMKSEDEIDVAFQIREGDSRNIVDMTYYDNNSIRGEMYNNGIPPHVISEQIYNSTYKAFEFKTEFLILNKLEDYGYTDYGNKDEGGNWAKWLSKANPCDYYNESEKTTGWRVPNQKELMVLMTLDKIPASGSMHISSTFAHYSSVLEGGYFKGYSGNQDDLPNHKVMYVRNTGGTAAGTQQDYSPNYQLRCVRDVDD